MWVGVGFFEIIFLHLLRWPCDFCTMFCWDSSVTQLCLTLRPHGLQHPCPSPFSWVFSNSCPLSQWCHPTISCSVSLFSSCLQSFPAFRCFPVSQFFAWGGQSIGVSASASVLPMNIQGSLSLKLTGLISLLSKGPSRVFSSTTVWKHQFRAQPLVLSLLYGPTLTCR